MAFGNSYTEILYNILFVLFKKRKGSEYVRIIEILIYIGLGELNDKLMYTCCKGDGNACKLAALLRMRA